MQELLELDKELRDATENLTKFARVFKASAVKEAESHCVYEEKKNRFLIVLYDEEVQQSIKRTEVQRKAMYRNEYAKERRDWLLAKADFESDRDLFKGLQSKIMALQSLIGIEKAKLNLQ